MSKSNKQKQQIKKKRLQKSDLSKTINEGRDIPDYLIDFDPNTSPHSAKLSIEMQEIINNAYDVFKCYPAPEKFNVCTACCMTVEEEQALRTLPLASLPRELIYSYNDSAQYPISGKAEVAYLLPRMLELIALNEDIRFTPELNLSWFEQVPYNNWLAEEKAILERFALQYFIELLKKAEQNQQLVCIDEYLVMFSRVGIPITDILKLISSNYNFYKIITIAYIIGYKKDSSLFIHNGFADNCRDISIIFEQWLKENIYQLKQYAAHAILHPEPVKDISRPIKCFIEQGLSKLSNGIY